MTTVTPDDIPTSVTKLVYTAPEINADAGTLGLSQNAAADLLAHFWPAIEQHIREQVAQDIEQATVTVDGGTYPMQTARTVERTLTIAAAIARGTDTTRSQS